MNNKFQHNLPLIPNLLDLILNFTLKILIIPFY